jgi:soluble lytic murein transglycosylase-like protein
MFVGRFCLLLLAGLNAWAGEYAILSTGFVMRVDRHETAGPNIRLFSDGGSVEFPAGLVVRFEPESASPPIPQQPAARSTTVEPRQLVIEAARRYGLPASLVHSIARAESGFQVSAVSPKGAIGVMQLMPETARMLGADPTDPGQNIDAGARYLSALLWRYVHDKYQVRKAIAAYNAGPGAVDRYNGVPPYRETVRYVEQVIRQSGIRNQPEASGAGLQ